MDDFLKLSRTAFWQLYGRTAAPESVTDPVVDKGLLAVARRNRMVGLWADRFPFIDPEWHRQACGQAVHSARLTAEAERIFSNLRNSVEDLRLIKGPALGVQAWPRPGLRSFDDLDFRCGKQSLAALTAGLQTLGYRPHVEDRRRQENLWHFGWGVSFRNDEGIILEFNHRMFPPHYPWPGRLTRPTSDLWGPLMLDHVSVQCPLPALHLLLSCVHAVWHGWERLGWLVDIAGLLVQHDNLFSHAEPLAEKNSFLRRALQGGCSVADRIFGPLPGVPPPHPDTREVIEQALELLMRQSPGVSLKTQREIHQRLMSAPEFIRYTALRLATPGDPDFKQWALPAGLRPLYWGLRPLRYVRERASRSLKN